MLGQRLLHTFGVERAHDQGQLLRPIHIRRTQPWRQAGEIQPAVGLQLQGDGEVSHQLQAGQISHSRNADCQPLARRGGHSACAGRRTDHLEIQAEAPRALGRWFQLVALQAGNPDHLLAWRWALHHALAVHQREGIRHSR